MARLSGKQEPGMKPAPRVVSLFASTLKPALTLLLPLTLALSGCGRNPFPSYPANYHEFAYVSNGASNTVTVLDLVYLRQDRVIQVGRQPTGLAVNPVRDEVYAVNSGSDSVSVIDSRTNRVAATIGVQRTPYFIAVSPDGKRGYVANSGSNTVSVLDLDRRRQIGVAATGEGPGMAKVSPDNQTLVVSNRVAGSLSVYTITDSREHPLQLREAYPGCAGATDVVVVANNASEPTSGAKAFVACSGNPPGDGGVAGRVAQLLAWQAGPFPAARPAAVLSGCGQYSHPPGRAAEWERGLFDQLRLRQHLGDFDLDQRGAGHLPDWFEAHRRGHQPG